MFSPETPKMAQPSCLHELQPPLQTPTTTAHPRPKVAGHSPVITCTDVLIPFLPNDVALEILARVPRQYHAVLSVVSKPIRSAISSLPFFTARSRLNCTESLLYIAITDLSPGEKYHWFAVFNDSLHPNPLKRRLLRFAPLPPVPLEPHEQVTWSSFAVSGPKIHALRDDHSSKMWALDCRSQTWEVLACDERVHGSYDYQKCVVDGVSYRCIDEYEGPDLRRAHRLRYEWFDERNGLWKTLEGAAEGQPKSMDEYRMVNLDGRLAVMFGVGAPAFEGSNVVRVELWCAKIDVTKKADGDLQGQVHWMEKVTLFTIVRISDRQPSSFTIKFKCLSVSL